MKRILVTGANGCIGKSLLRLLVQKGYEVHAVSRKKVNSKDNFIHWYQVDLTELCEIEELFKVVKPTYLMHLAWDITPGKYKNSPSNLTWVQASIEIIINFKRYGGKRVVISGTCSEYDTGYGYLNEILTLCNPNSLYGTCKTSLHKIVEKYCIENDIELSWTRIFFLYGPNENSNRVIPYVINQLLKGEVAHVSHGNQIRDYLYVHDVANALANIIDSNVLGIINIGSGHPVKLKDIFMEIGEKLGKSDLITFGDFKTDEKEPYMIVADNKRLINEIGWKQHYSLERGLNETIEWWKSKLINERKIITKL